MAKRELNQFLLQTPEFAHLDSARLEEISSAASVHEYRAGEELASQDWHSRLWLPVQGLLRLAYRLTGGAAPTLSLAGRHELLGCVDALCRDAHELSCLAVIDSLVAVLPRQKTLTALAGDAKSASAVIHALSRRAFAPCALRGAGASAEQRLAGALLVLSERLGGELPLTRRVIAEISGLARETAIRGLAPLERQGLIRSRRGSVEIVDAKGLARLAKQ